MPRLLPTSSLPTRRRRLAGLPLLAGIALLPACGGDDLELPAPTTVDEAVLRAELGAWKARVRKDCSLADAMPSAYRSGQRPPVNLELDAAHVTRLLGPELFTERGGELFVLDAPRAPSRSGFANVAVSARVDDDVIQDLRLGSELAWDGTCVVTYDGEEVFRGQLWAQLPVAIHARVPAADGAIAREDGRRQVYHQGLRAEIAYVADDSLRVLVTGLRADLPAATAAFAAALGLDAAALERHVVAAPTWLDHVVVDGAVAPAPVVEIGPNALPLDVVADPTFPIADADLGGHLRAGVHAATVRLPRHGRDGAGFASVTVRYTTADLGDDVVRTSITGVDRPSYGPPRRLMASSCVANVASAAGRFLRGIASGGAGTAVPVPVMPGPGVAELRWAIAPCERFSTDLAAELRADDVALGALVDLLDPALYGTRGLSPNRWAPFLAAVVTDATAVDTLARAAWNAAGRSSAEAQRALLRHARYAAAEVEEKTALRALVWQTSILCGGPVSAAQLDTLLKVPADEITGTLAGMTACPAS
jgi:hypothetical protein